MINNVTTAAPSKKLDFLKRLIKRLKSEEKPKKLKRKRHDTSLMHKMKCATNEAQKLHDVLTSYKLPQLPTTETLNRLQSEISVIRRQVFIPAKTILSWDSENDEHDPDYIENLRRILSACEEVLQHWRHFIDVHQAGMRVLSKSYTSGSGNSTHDHPAIHKATTMSITSSFSASPHDEMAPTNSQRDRQSIERNEMWISTGPVSNRWGR